MWCKVSIVSKRKGQCERELLKCVYWWNKLLLTNTLSLLTQWGLWIYKNHAKLVCEYFLWLRVTELWFVCLWILYPVTYCFLYSFIYLLIDDFCFVLQLSVNTTCNWSIYLSIHFIFIYIFYIYIYIYIYIYMRKLNWNCFIYKIFNCNLVTWFYEEDMSKGKYCLCFLLINK